MTVSTIQESASISETSAVIVQPKNKADWDRFVMESPGVIAWHAYDWGEMLRRYYGTEFYPIAVYNGSRIEAILPLYRTRLFRKEALISVPYFVAGGIVAQDAKVQAILLNKAVEIAQKLNIPTITLKQYKLRLEGPLKTDANYYNRELSLSPDINQLWDGLSDVNRSKIEESRRFDLVCEYPSSNVSDFYKLLLHDQHSAGVPCVSKRWLQTLFDTGMYEIALMRRGQEILAGTMVKKFRDTVSFPFSCVRDRSEATEFFAYALYWELITRLAKSGIRIAHSGRIPNTDATFRYRLGWGGTRYNYYYQYYGLGQGNTEFSTKRGRKRELIESVWKRIPAGITQLVSPFIVKQFP